MLFGVLDLAFIVKVVLSLCVLLFTYDAICGEKEQGTLRLYASYPVSRSAQALAKLAGSTVAQQGSLTVVGIGGGTFPWNFFTVPYEVNLSSTYWGTIEDLHEVVAMYRQGQIAPLVRRFSLDDALEAYRQLRDGELSARAVVVPHGW